MKDSMPVLFDVLTKLATHKPVPRGDLLVVMTEISAVLDRVAVLEEAAAMQSILNDAASKE